jgi:hypothetical protein
VICFLVEVMLGFVIRSSENIYNLTVYEGRLGHYDVLDLFKIFTFCIWQYKTFFCVDFFKIVLRLHCVLLLSLDF